jgi:hypothetical protein
MRYFYYRIYQLLKQVKSNNTPALNALLLLGLIQTINIATILSIIKIFTKIEIGKQQITIGGLAISIILLITEFKTLFRKKDEIFEQYKNETKEEIQRGTVCILLYIIISVAIFFVIVETFIK